MIRNSLVYHLEGKMMYRQQIDVAHVLGLVGKWLIVLAVFGLSITLSYMFFLAIAPPDKPWFPIAGLSLTEGGFLVWMFVFRMIRYHPIHKSIALLMSLACAACSLTVAGFEFYALLATHFDLLTNPLVSQYVAMFLLAIFAAHFVALIAELLVGESEKNPFHQRGEFASFQGGNARKQLTAEEFAQTDLFKNWKNSLQGGEPARPLASRKARPKEVPMSLNNQTVIEEEEPESIEEENPKPLKTLPKPRKTSQPVYQNLEKGMLSEGASLLTQKLSGFIRNTRTAVRVRGNQNETTNENM
jgi:hypothetical protein